MEDLTDSEIEDAIGLDAEKLQTFKRAYGDLWREIALRLISMNKAAQGLRPFCDRVEASRSISRG